MAKTDRVILVTNDQQFGQVADPNKLENMIAHAYDKIDENDTEFVNHKKQVDPSSADTARDKHVSNNDLKGLQDQITTNLNDLTTHKKQVDPTSSDTTRDKHVANNDLKTLQNQITTNDTASVNRDNAHKTAVVLDHPDQSVTTEKLKDFAVTSNKIANGAVSRNQLDPSLFEQTANASKFQEIDAQLADITTYPSKYGAVGGGVNDDTTPFQNALDNAIEGGVVDLEGKHYGVKGVTINKKLHLKNGTITLLNSATKSVIEIANTVIGAELSDLKIYIDKVNVVGTDLSGIFINGATNTTIKNCYVEGSKNTNYNNPYMHSSIYAHMASGITITNCIVKSSDKEGIMTRLSDDVFIYQCQTYNCGYSGIGTSGGNRAIIEACISYDSGTSSITLNSKDSIVKGCIVKGNSDSNGITVGHNNETQQYAENCIVTNNRIINSANYGIAVTYPLDCTVSDNIINSCVNDGISISTLANSVNNVVVNSNAINNCAIGIRVFGNSSANLIIANNNIDTCPTYGIYINIYGHANIQGNVIKDSGSNFLSGYNSGSTIYGNLETLIYSNNQNINVPATNLSLFNIKNAKISDNYFKNINTTNNANGGCIIVLATVGGANGLIPHTVVENNTLIGGLGSTWFVRFYKDLSDANPKHFIIKENVLLNITYTNLLSNADVNNPVTLWNNKIGADKKNVTVTLPTGQTSLVVTNSNWHGNNMKPILKPLNGNFYNAKPYISSITNANITIAYTDSGSNVDIEVTYL